MQAKFRELKVWQDAKAIAIDVYLLIRNASALNDDWGLKDQMQRAAVSIASNIAEGDARESDKDACRFFYIAKGSAAELMTQLEISVGIGSTSSASIEHLVPRLELLSKSLGALIKSRQKTYL